MAEQAENQINRLTIDPLKYLNNLPEFYGDSKDLQTFTTLIDRIYPHLRTYDELSQLLFSDVIKSKLKGKARQAIEINCHAISWTDIKNMLQNNFGDRRSCEELFDKLKSVTFRTNTLDFYNDVKDKLHRLNNKLVVILGEGEATRQSAINNKHTALNIFKSKIPEPMKSILFCRNPEDLEQAMDILFQAGYAYTGSNENRAQPNAQSSKRRNYQQPPPNHGRNHQQPFPNQGRNYLQPFPNQGRNYQQPFPNHEPNFQNPFHANRQNTRNQPEPMEIGTAENFQDRASASNYHI